MASSGTRGNGTTMPAASRALQKKWEERRLQEHRDRLRKVKPTVDNSPPTDFVHLKQKLRKRQIEEDRWRLVDRHNRELLMRMNTIMHSTGRVEHRNVDWKPKKSLGFVKRQEEMQRVQRDNQAILKRIQTVKPQYSVKKWESDYHSHVQRCRSMSQALSEQPRPQRQLRKNKTDFSLPQIIHPLSTPAASEVHEEIDVET